MFPEFQEQSTNMIYNSKMKRYILMACSLFQSNPSENDKLELRGLKNWFLTKDKPKFGLGLEIERNFLALISLLELNEDVSVLAFYSKLDYINKKNARESAAYERH